MIKSTLKNVLATAVVAAGLSACAYVIPPRHIVETANANYDPTVSARMRILSSSGTNRTAIFWVANCYKSKIDSTAIRGDRGELDLFLYSSRSVVIGMPPSPRKSMQVDGLFNVDRIREYVVPAGKPVTLSLGMSVYTGTYGGTTSCAAPAVTFTPMAGQDYDVFLDTGGRSCWTAIRHIDGHGMDDPVPVTRAPECSTNPASTSIDTQ